MLGFLLAAWLLTIPSTLITEAEEGNITFHVRVVRVIIEIVEVDRQPLISFRRVSIHWLVVGWLSHSRSSSVHRMLAILVLPKVSEEVNRERKGS